MRRSKFTNEANSLAFLRYTGGDMLYIDVLVFGFALVMNSPALESRRVGIPWFAVTSLQFAFLSNDSSGYLKPPAGRYKFQLTVLNSNDANDQNLPA